MEFITLNEAAKRAGVSSRVIVALVNTGGLAVHEKRGVLVLNAAELTKTLPVARRLALRRPRVIGRP